MNDQTGTRVSFGEVSVPVTQIEEVEDGIIVNVQPNDVAGYRRIAAGRSLNVSTPDDSFEGTLTAVQFEHGGVLLYIERDD